MTGDLSPSVLTAAVGAKLAGLTDIPIEQAELLAVSVVGALPVDEDEEEHLQGDR